MKIASVYSHLNGREWMLVHRKQIWSEIQSIIESLDSSTCRTKISKEKRRQGAVLMNPKALNRVMKEAFEERDWRQARTDYWVTDDYELIRKTMSMSTDEQKNEIEATGRIPIRSYNQTDFVKERVAVEVQFGKYAFISHDLFVKHLAFYVGHEIDVGVEILPMKAMQAQMSSGVGYYEGALYDVVRQGRGVPTVPLVIIGVLP